MSMMGSRDGKHETPCDTYFGNVCSGFGGSLTCDLCGWDMYDHPEFNPDWDGWGDPE